MIDSDARRERSCVNHQGTPTKQMRKVRSFICRAFSFSLAWVAIFILTACASLPNVQATLSYYERSPTSKPPSIMGADGKLAEKYSAAILKRLEKQAGPSGILQKHEALIEEFSDNPLVAGNRVVLLLGGDAAFAAMFRAISNSRDHINLETFIFEDDRIGRVFAALLTQKRNQGVAVNVIYDSVGSYKTPRSFFERMREHGIQVLEYNPINPLQVRDKWAIHERDHRKLLIVDGKVVITGGLNITDVHSTKFSGSSLVSRSSSPLEEDTAVKIEGPVVATYQKLFLEQWSKQKGPALPAANYFPEQKPKGNELVRVIANSSGEWNRDIYISYVSALAFADRSIRMANAYFAPDEQTLEAIIRAARRGVDVKIILTGESDSKLAFYGARSYYQELLQTGVEVYEFRKAVLHSKIAVIDNVWSTVGSTNLDPWSLLRNDEVNAVILGREFADRMKALFADYLSQSDEILLHEWRKRSIYQRMLERLGRLFWYWL